jgi:hypothetical protein
MMNAPKALISGIIPEPIVFITIYP